MASIGRLLLIPFAVIFWVASAMTAAQAVDYPTKPITLIVPTPAGGTIDGVARIVANRLGEKLGQSVIVENRPGANGYIAARYVSRAAPDGYTLLVFADSYMVGPFAQKSFDLDLAEDLAPIVSLCDTWGFFLANGKSQFKTPADMVAFAKANPGKLSFASPIISTTFDAALLFSKLGVEVVIVSYQGTAPAIQGLLSNSVNFAQSAFGNVKGQVEEGNIRPLFYMGPKRNPLTPDVPTIGEVWPGIEAFGGRLGLSGPKGISQEIVMRLNSEIVSILKEPAVMEKIVTGFGFDPIEGNTPESWRQKLITSRANFSQAAKILKFEPQ